MRKLLVGLIVFSLFSCQDDELDRLRNTDSVMFFNGITDQDLVFISIDEGTPINLEYLEHTNYLEVNNSVTISVTDTNGNILAEEGINLTTSPSQNTIFITGQGNDVSLITARDEIEATSQMIAFRFVHISP